MGQPGHEGSGRKLLREKNCTKCHTFGGKGGDIGPDFTGSDDYLTPLSLAAAMWNHGPGMMGLFQENNIDRPTLNGREIVDLSAGIRSFMMPNRVPPGTDRPGSTERGSLLVENKRCTFCHGGPSGRNDGASDFRDMRLKTSVTQIAGNMWNHGPKMWEMMEEKEVEFPTLTAVEMADIIAFLYELRLQDPPGSIDRGEELVYDKGCINCHAIDGKGAAVGSSFTEIGSLSSPVSMISLMWNHAEDMNEAVREQGRRWPKFSGKELADIYAYLRTIADSQKPQ
jgi:mono/diheme cytochrome c family protein